MSNNQEHTNTDNMENQTQQALEKDSAQYANEVTGAENAAEKDSAGKKPGSTVPGSDEKRIRVFRAGTPGLTGVQGIFQQISEKHAQFRLRDDRVIGQLNVDVKLDSGAFRLICIEGKNGVERIIVAVYAVRMGRMLFFVVCEV